MTYFISSQKLVLYGDEKSVKMIDAQYKEFALSKQREKGMEIDKNLKSRRH